MSLLLLGWSKGVILSNFYFLHFFTRALLHALKLGVGWWVAHMSIVSAQSKELGFWVFLDLVWPQSQDLGQGIGDLDSGLTIALKAFQFEFVKIL